MSAPTFDVLRPTITRVEKPTVAFAAALVPYVDPTSLLPVKLGEWLTLSGDELARPGTGDNVEYTKPSFPYWEWTGQTDVQSSLKGTVLLPIYEAWTLMWNYLTNPPTAYGDKISIAKAAAGNNWAGYYIPRKSAAGGFDVGWVLSPVPTAYGQRLTFRANY
jgi:hypothetical protein